MRIKVTFKDSFPEDMIREWYDTEFLGLCGLCKTTENPRVLLLWPTKDEYRSLKISLDELDSEGALSFVEEPRE